MRMGYLILGVLAFVLAGLFDLAALRQWRRAKQVSGAAAVLLFSYAVVMVALHPDRLQIPALLSWAGWGLLVLSVLLLVYSLFLEIPFAQTYVGEGVGDQLITTGTYALVRHPGVLWLALFLLALVLVSGSRLLLMATPLWLAVDVLYVWLQEETFLGRVFPGYDEYRKETPMILPSRKSMGRCYETTVKRLLNAGPATSPSGESGKNGPSIRRS
jgi:protein-S-isoprenylcysteine O-methyltransferase Ste14